MSYRNEIKKCYWERQDKFASRLRLFFARKLKCHGAPIPCKKSFLRTKYKICHVLWCLFYFNLITLSRLNIYLQWYYLRHLRRCGVILSRYIRMNLINFGKNCWSSRFFVYLYLLSNRFLSKLWWRGQWDETFNWCSYQLWGEW